MRLVRLELSDFQSVGQSRIDFGPGLNVVFGPNDFGKSTMATAVRAALLVPAGSAEGDTFKPWHKDAAPRVILTFVDRTQKYWKIDKTFSRNGGSAELHFSKDGTQFSLEVKARQVDERLRNLLGWGIPAPGGKGGPKGLPTSFLSNALLGQQADIDHILSQSIKEDPDETGRLSLQTGLATLAQDPVFKKMLGRVQKQVETYFTNTGRRKGGQGSPFVEVRDRLNKSNEQIGELRRKVTEATQVEAALDRLRTQQDEARDTQLQALALATGKRAAAKRVGERDVAADELEQAQVELASFDTRATALENKRQELDGASLRLAAANEEVTRLRALAEQATANAEAAQGALLAAQSSDGASKVELEKAQININIAQLEQRLDQARVRQSVLADVHAAGASVGEARAQLATAEVEVTKRNEALTGAVKAFENAAADLAPVKLCRVYGRFKVAQAAQEHALDLRRKRSEGQTTRDTKTAELGTLGVEVVALTEQRNGLLIDLPSEAELGAAEALERQIEVVQAALGGGATVTLRRRSDVAVRIGTDGSSPTALEQGTEPLAVELERQATIEVGDFLSIEITTGATEKRRELERLNQGWQAKGGPLLEKANLGSLAAVRAQLSQAAQLTVKLQALASREALLDSELNQLTATLVQQEQQVADLERQASAVEALEVELVGKDLGLLEKIWRSLGDAWEAGLDAREEAAVAALDDARTAHGAAESALSVAQVKLDQAASELKRTEIELAQRSKVAGLPEGTDALIAGQALDGDVAEMEKSLTLLQRRSADLAGASHQAVVIAEEALARANQHRDESRRAADKADNELTEARSLVDTFRGEVKIMAEQLDPAERVALADRVTAKVANLALFADVSANASVELADAEEALSGADKALGDITRELDQERGALTKVAGMATKEELARAEEAKQQIEQDQEQLELDTDAWRLLHDTMREVENEQGAHLGRSLAGPVATKFASLTQGRYGDLALDANLTTTGVAFVGGAPEGTDVLRALSVGTRNQLATLLRLTIAEQLRSSIILDDQLVNSDGERLNWFHDALIRVAVNAQVIVLTCRPRDYLSAELMPAEEPFRDLAGGAIRAIDVTRVVQR